MYQGVGAALPTQGIGAALTVFVTQMLGLSIAAERVTETIKQAISSITSKLSPPLQSALTQTIAIFSAMFVVALSHADPLNVTKGSADWLHSVRGWECIVFTGILASGGSAVWNHLLDILKATKVNSEQAADAKLIATNQPPMAT
jgi:hypothetical protein